MDMRANLYLIGTMLYYSTSRPALAAVKSIVACNVLHISCMLSYTENLGRLHLRSSSRGLCEDVGGPEELMFCSSPHPINSQLAVGLLVAVVSDLPFQTKGSRQSLPHRFHGPGH